MLATNLLIIACTLFFEAGGESTLGKRAVASVILNRARERRITMQSACLQPRQFSCWNNRRGQLPKHLPRGKVWDEGLVLAQQMLDKEFEPIINSNHFYNPKLCHPKWADEMTDVRVIGNHIFGRCR